MQLLFIFLVALKRLVCRWAKGMIWPEMLVSVGWDLLVANGHAAFKIVFERQEFIHPIEGTVINDVDDEGREVTLELARWVI